MEAQDVIETGRKVPPPAPRNGHNTFGGALVRFSAELATGMADATFGMTRDAKTLINRRLMNTIDWVDSTQQEIMKLSRDLTIRIDRLADIAIDSSESLTQSAIGAGRDMGHATNALAGKAAASIVGPESEEERPHRRILAEDSRL